MEILRQTVLRFRLRARISFLTSLFFVLKSSCIAGSCKSSSHSDTFKEDLHNQCAEQQTKMIGILDDFSKMSAGITEHFWMVTSADDVSSVHDRMQVRYAVFLCSALLPLSGIASSYCLTSWYSLILYDIIRSISLSNFIHHEFSSSILRIVSFMLTFFWPIVPKICVSFSMCALGHFRCFRKQMHSHAADVTLARIGTLLKTAFLLK